ncbi:hypothetical protein Gpo141_00014144, partial [Globisporangium polare]
MDPNCPVLESQDSSMESPRGDYVDAPGTPATKPVVYQSPINHGIQMPTQQQVSTEGVIPT